MTEFDPSEIHEGGNHCFKLEVVGKGWLQRGRSVRSRR